MVTFIASDLADRPWIPITAALVILTSVVVAVRRSAWVALAAIVGAFLGALAFLPVGGYVADGPPRCESCGAYVSVLIGSNFRVPWNGPRTAAISALVCATAFAATTVGVLAIRERRRRHTHDAAPSM